MSTLLLFVLGGSNIQKEKSKALKMSHIVFWKAVCSAMVREEQRTATSLNWAHKQMKTSLTLFYNVKINLLDVNH